MTYPTLLKRIALAATPLAFAAVMASPALSQDDLRTEFTFRFEYEANLLQSYAGAEGVYRDLRSSARRACRRDGVVLTAFSHDRDCIARLVDAVVARIDAPLLTARHTNQGARRYAERHPQDSLFANSN